jgi:hypothetical protein
MNLFKLIALILFFMNSGFGQDLKILIADGTERFPKRYDLQPSVESLKKEEQESIKKAALEKTPEISIENYQISSEESNFRGDFRLLDVAKGFFISREIEFRAYLYTAFSPKIKRNYQGIIVFSISENGTKFKTTAHYVYKFRGDKFIRQVSDINGNFLSEIAIFSELPIKTELSRNVRIIEFSPDGINKIGSQKIYSSIPQKQRTPWKKDKSQPAKRIYTPPKVSAVKLFAVKKIAKAPEFHQEKWTQINDRWSLVENFSLPSECLIEDLTDYIEIFKPPISK